MSAAAPRRAAGGRGGAARRPARGALGGLAPAAGLIALAAAWELAARSGLLAQALGIDEATRGVLVPAPTDVAEALWADRALLAANLRVTLVEVVAGLALSLAAGLAAALAMHLSRPLERALYPLVVASQTIPVIAIAPLLVIWLGYGIGPKLVVIALICFFPVAVNTFDGLRSVDPAAIRMLRTLDADRRSILLRVELPTALPYFFSGARIAVAVAVIGAVFGEWVGADEGLGHLMLVAQGQLLTARVLAAVAVLSALAVALFWSVGAAERRVAWWGRESLR